MTALVPIHPTELTTDRRDLLLTKADAARLLRVRRTRIDALVREGCLEAVVLGAYPRITRASLDAYLRDPHGTHGTQATEQAALRAHQEAITSAVLARVADALEAVARDLRPRSGGEIRRERG